MFVLEDRVTARTNSGENEPEGNPNNIPEVSSIVGGIVGNTAPSEWGQNVTDAVLELKVGHLCNAGQGTLPTYFSYTCIHACIHTYIHLWPCV